MFFLPSFIIAISFKSQIDKDAEIARSNNEFEIAKRGVYNLKVALEIALSEQANKNRRVQTTEWEKKEAMEKMYLSYNRTYGSGYDVKAKDFKRHVELYNNEVTKKKRIDKGCEDIKCEVAELEKELDNIQGQRDDAMNGIVLK